MTDPSRPPLPSRGGLADLDLSTVRAHYGLTAVPHLTITASELANLGFCEALVVLSGLHPRQPPTAEVAQRRAAGQQAHATRAARLRRQFGPPGD